MVNKHRLRTHLANWGAMIGTSILFAAFCVYAVDRLIS